MLRSAWSWLRAAIPAPTRRTRRSRGWTAPPPILTCRSFMPALGSTAPALSPTEVACSASPHAGATSKRRNRALTLPLTRSAGRKGFRAGTSAGALCRKGKLQRVKVRSRHGQLVALAFRPGGVACRMTLCLSASRFGPPPPTGSEEFMVIRKSDYRLWALAALALLAAGSMMAGLAWSEPASDSNSDLYSQLNLFGEVLSRVRSDYVEKPDDQKLVEDAIRGMLMALDPHSTYLTAKEVRDMQVQTKGEFGGLGIEVTMENGMIKVVSPIEDTPAAKAGLLSGDLITALDREPIEGLTLEEAVEKMRGPVNAPITLTIVRKGVDNPFDVKMVR